MRTEGWVFTTEVRHN